MPTIADCEEVGLQRATEARSLADLREDPETKRELLQIAEQYERLAALARGRQQQVQEGK
jgi:hypothetical protein